MHWQGLVPESNEKGINMEMKKNKVIEAAMGTAEFDLVIQNVNFVNVFTKEIYQADIGIADKRIAHVTQPGEKPLTGKNIYNGKGKYAIPGLIDTHVHTECSMMTPYHMAEAILPTGTTTIVCDPHEMANVMGIDGVKYILDASKDIYLHVYVTAPSCVPSVEGLETAGASFFKEEIQQMMKMDRVIGLAEVMDYYGVIHQSDRMQEIVETAGKYKGLIAGHAPGLMGRELSAYLAAGIQSCHESTFAEEARSKLRAGMTVECKESSNVPTIKELAPVLKEFGYPINSTFCTDDRAPDDILKDGNLDYVVRRAIEEGIPPVEAISMATYHASILTGLSEYGTLKPGNIADVLLLDDMEHFVVNEVFVEGELVAKKGKLLKKIPAIHPWQEQTDTIHLSQNLTEDTFRIPAKGEKAKVNLIQFNDDDPIMTEKVTRELPVTEGFVNIQGMDELATMAVLERHGKNGNIAVGLVENIGLKYGAVATTFSHDCHNLIVLGKNEADMLLAAKILKKYKGGIVCVHDGKADALVELPIAGITSPKPIEELAPEFKQLNDTMRTYGIKGACPFIQLGCLNLPVVPKIKLTDRGLVDVETQTMISILCEQP